MTKPRYVVIMNPGMENEHIEFECWTYSIACKQLAKYDEDEHVDIMYRLDDGTLTSDFWRRSPMTELTRILMRRDGMTQQEAQDAVIEARGRVRAGEDPEEILYEEFGLEPDYIWDLL